MRHDFRWLVVFTGNAVFLWVAAQANHHLASVPLGSMRGPAYVFLLGLPIAFCALRLTLGQGLAAVIPTALLFEAGLPIYNGVLMLTSAACLCTAIALRSSFNRFESTTALLVVLLTNLALISAVTIAAPPPIDFASGMRIVVDLALSQLAVAVLTGWFFACQMAFLRIFGFNLETELREPL